MTPHVLITRPETSGRALAERLKARWGADTPITLSPVIQIAPRATALDLTGIGALIFTSRHGVAAFGALSQRRDIPCLCVGPATTAAALALGLEASDLGGDARQMVEWITTRPPSGQCLHLHGVHVTGDVVQSLNAAGIPARGTIVYDQIAQPLSPEARNVLSRERAVILPLYSPRSAALVFEGTAPKAPLWVAALSPAVAARVPADLGAEIELAAQPNGPAMLETLDSLRQNAIRVEARKAAK